MPQIPDYTQAQTINTTDLFVIEQQDGTKKATVAQIKEKTLDGLTAANLPLGSDFSDPTSTAGAVKANETAISGKADKSTSVSITPETNVTLVYNSSRKIDKLVVCSCAFEKTGGWASGWQKIATLSDKPNATITVSVTNASNGGAVGMGAIYDTTGEIRYYAPSAGAIRIAYSFCYATP